MSGPLLNKKKRPRIDWRPGSLIAGRYIVRKLIGAGGMGVVAVADDLFLCKPVAVKALRPSVAIDSENVERFRREVALAHTVTHPNIVRTYDLGESRGVHFFTMEFVEGEPLSRDLRKRKKIPAAEVTALAIQICDALQAAHKARVIHRDLKPSNLILVPDDRRVLIMDFGISGLLDSDPQAAGRDLVAEREESDDANADPKPEWDVTSFGMGTPKYMSPEQWLGEPTGPTSDIYSLGVILFQCLAGRPPFQCDSDDAFAAAHIETEAPKIRTLEPAVPRALESVIDRCLQKDPTHRFQSAGELVKALEPDQRIAKTARFTLRAAILALIVGAFGWGVYSLAQRAIVVEMRPAVQRLAELVARDIDVAHLDAIHVAEDVNSEEYRIVQSHLAAVNEANPDVLFVYVMRRLSTADDFEFVVDADPYSDDLNGNGIIDPDENSSLPGAVYSSEGWVEMTQCSDEGIPTADPEFSRDAWALLLSGYAPVGDHTGPGAYIVGVDVDSTRMQFFRNLLISLCVAIWLVLLALPALLNTAASRRLLRHWVTPAASI